MKILTIAGAAMIAAVAIVDAHDPITTRVTWDGEISRIVQARCIKCHSPDGPGPMSLVNYEDARPWARAMKEEVLTRRMPKWHAVRGYGDFSNDPSLSAFEIALIVAWADGGAPETEKEKGKREMAERPASAEKSRRDLRDTSNVAIGFVSRDVTIPCGDRALPEGTLTAIRPQLEEDQSVGIAVKFPDGRREIVGWIRKYDPEFPTTYELRRPFAVPAGSILTTEPKTGCAVVVTMTAPR
jgi:hypothetical protein